MKKFLMLIACISLSLKLSAYDFEVNGVYYAITSEEYLTCEVQAKEKISTYDYRSDYSGDIVIPEQVEYNQKLYTVTSIGRQAFCNRGTVTSVVMPNTITNIGYEAFANCTGLSQIILPQSLDYIGNSAFDGCSGLESIVLPNKVTYVGIWSFGRCTSIKEVVLPASLKTLGGCAFTGCTNLEEVAINNPSISGVNWNEYGRPFANDNIKTIRYGEGVEIITDYGANTVSNIILPSTAKEIKANTFNGYSKLTDITIPNGLLTIGNSAFNGCTNLSTINIPNSVTSVGTSAFKDCVNLETATISRKITEISDGLFDGCVKLSDFSLPGGTMSIKSNAFRNCKSLKEIVIPTFCTSIEGSAFSGCSSLSAFNVSADNTKYSDIDGVLTDKEKKTIVCFPSGKCKDYIIPSTIEYIGSYAFSGCILQSINIPASVSSCGIYSFANCENLRSVVFDDADIYFSQEEIDEAQEGDVAYGKTTDDIKFPANQSINYGTYFNGSYVVYGFVFSNTPIENLYIGRNIWWSVNTSVSSGQDWFSGKTSLKKLTISNNVTDIYEGMFSGCSGLSDITLPESITNIGDKFINGCSGLTKIHAKMQNPPALNASAFEGIDKTNCTLYVPSSVIGKYESTPGWLSFDNIEAENDVQATSLAINKSSTNLIIGNGEQLYANIIPTYTTNKQVKWSSSNNEVVTVSELDGYVTAVGEGIAVVYAETIDGSELIAQCDIVVTSYNYIYDENGIMIKKLLSLEKDEADFCELNDSYKSINITEDIPLSEITYTRNFTNTNWNAFYVPFVMQYDDWSEYFEVARLNDVHQFDDDEDGEIDRTVLESVKLKEGSSIEPNTPYMIKAKMTGEKTITLTDAILYATEENCFNVTSWFTKFTFTGTYKTITDMATKGYYAMSDGGLKQASSDAATLGAFRWYLDITDRNGNPVSLMTKKVFLSFDDGETTAIDVVNTNIQSYGSVYSISGVKMANDAGLPKGLYIKNGKKVLVK